MIRSNQGKSFQDYMSGNVCYGCGIKNKKGLQIKSFWVGQKSHCYWSPQPHFEGWRNIMNGGIIATIIDCHCMGTAMAYAYKKENRELSSSPHYRYATANLNISYLKPTPNDKIFLECQVNQYTDKKVIMSCIVYSGKIKTVESEVVAVRVFDSSKSQKKNIFKD